MKKSILLLSTIVLLGLVSCNQTSTSVSSTSESSSSQTSSQGSSSNVTSNTTSSSSSSSSGGQDQPVVTEYAIRVTVPSAGVTIVADKEKAQVGDTVTLTVTLDDGYSIVKLLANTTECTKVNETTYQFIMPNRSVSVTCQLAVDGDITIQGDVAARFVEEDGIYVARNVSFTSGSGNFSVYVHNTMMTVQNIDRTKCLCDFELSSGYTGKLALNTVYDFYYDATNDGGIRPLYIKRVGLTSLPNTVDSLYSLFAGRVQSSACSFPSNLTGATYSNTEDDVKYSYQVDKNGLSSLATVSKLSDNSNVGYIYREKDETNGVYKWVDTTVSYNGLDGKAGKAKISDYKIFADGVSNEESDDDEFDDDRQYIHSNVVDFEVTKNFEYNLYDLEFDFMDAYRVGMNVEDYVKSASCEITSTAIAGSTHFNTSIVSSKTYDSSTATDSSVESEQIHYEFRVDFEFTKAGELVSLAYKQYTFDTNTYNFTTDAFISGDVDSNLSKGTLVKKLDVAYEYSIEHELAFDATPYFISSIDTLAITSQGEGSNEIKSGDRIEEESSYITMTYSPSTALDGWQYGVVESSNDNVVAYDSSYRCFIGQSSGTTTLTVSNYSDQQAKKTCDVTIADIKLRNIYMLVNDFNGKITLGYDDLSNTNEVNIKAGIVSSIGIDFKDASNNKSCAAPSDLTFTFDKDVGLNVYVDKIGTSNYAIYYDATNVNISEDTTVNMTLNTNAYDSSWVESPIVFTINIKPNSFTSDSDLIGRWVDSSNNVFNVIDKNYSYTATSGEVKLFNANIVTASGDTYKAVFDYNTSTGNFSYCHILNSSNAFDSDYTLNLVVDGQKIGMYLCSQSYEGLDSTTTTDIIGESDGDEDYNTITYSYFTKAQ